MAKLITLKNTVKPASLVILAAAANAASELDLTITITSGNDSKHANNSKHYECAAIDIRSKTMTPADKKAFISNLQDRLGTGYLVLLEDATHTNEHIHVQIKGTYVHP